MKTHRSSRQAFLPLVAALLAGGAPAATHGIETAPAAELGFERYELSTGDARGQAVLTGFLLGGPVAELAVVEAGEDGRRSVRLYRLAGDAWQPFLDAALPPRARFVDVVEIGGRDRLITLGDGRLDGFDPATASVRFLLEIPADRDPHDPGEIFRVDLGRDLNGDGREDLVVPRPDGFWISTQRSDGSFTDPMRVGPSEPFLDEISVEHQRTYRELGLTAETFPWYLQRLHQTDWDRDGRDDLVFWNEDHFEVHLQDERGLFDRRAKTFAAGMPLDGDGDYSLQFGYGEARPLSLILGTRKKTRRTVLHSLRDVDGDGVADLTTHSLEGRSLLRLRGRSEVRLGTPAPGGTSFAPNARSAVAGRSRPLGYSLQQLEDFDADGHLDILVLDVRTGMGGMIRALVGNSIAVDLELYRGEDGRYPERPTIRRKIRPDRKVLARRGPFFPTVLLGDFNGDGYSDLFVGQSREEARVYAGQPGPGLLATEPRRVEVALTADERDARLVDLNRDGKDDVLVHHPAATGPQRLVTLIAR